MQPVRRYGVCLFVLHVSVCVCVCVYVYVCVCVYVWIECPFPCSLCLQNANMELKEQKPQTLTSGNLNKMFNDSFMVTCEPQQRRNVMRLNI